VIWAILAVLYLVLDHIAARLFAKLVGGQPATCGQEAGTAARARKI
jgi:hypothetical protein